MLLTGLWYHSVVATPIRFRRVRKSGVSFIRISLHNGARFHVENSTRLRLIRSFNHLLCSTLLPPSDFFLWRVIIRLWSSSRMKKSMTLLQRIEIGNGRTEGEKSEGKRWQDGWKPKALGSASFTSTEGQVSMCNQAVIPFAHIWPFCPLSYIVSSSHCFEKWPTAVKNGQLLQSWIEHQSLIQHPGHSADNTSWWEPSWSST